MASRYPFPSVPDGWFTVGTSEDFEAGELRTLHYLDRELVGFRGEDGQVRVLDAHCPHLGAHLGVGGVVSGNTVACPFHGWCFDGDGTLVEVPRLDGPVPKVEASTWEVRECNGHVFVWHHAQGLPPAYEVTAYRDDGADWTPWRTTTYRVRIHVQELTENIIDRSHFWTVHDMEPPDDPRFDVRFDGHVMTVDQRLKVTAVADTGYEVSSLTTTNGPGIVAVEIREGPLEMLQYITQTPIDDEHTEVTLHFSMQALEDTEATEAISKLNDEVTNVQFNQDVPIWENKVYRERPPVTQIDGPITQYRRWFRQFYSTLAED